MLYQLYIIKHLNLQWQHTIWKHKAKQVKVTKRRSTLICSKFIFHRLLFFPFSIIQVWKKGHNYNLIEGKLVWYRYIQVHWKTRIVASCTIGKHTISLAPPNGNACLNQSLMDLGRGLIYATYVTVNPTWHFWCRNHTTKISIRRLFSATVKKKKKRKIRRGSNEKIKMRKGRS